VLVEAQGEMLDNIENQVGKSVEYVHKGHASLVQARKYQKSSRWWMCCSLIIVTIIAMAVILPVVKPWSA
jgi:syntaxin 1B/2/3|tara:strand:+ start:1016 stop:1225 length:210 start_codon:yes stop_codon:yes gene_type:complete